MSDGLREIELQLAAERTISRISSSLIATDSDRIAKVARSSLAELGPLFDLDRARLVAFGDSEQRVALAEDWCAPRVGGVMPELHSLSGEAWWWWADQLAPGKPVEINPPEGLEGAPPEVRSSFSEAKTGTLLLVPVTVESHVRGVLTVSTVGRRMQLSAESVALLTLVAECFVNRLERARTERKLEALLRELEVRYVELSRSNQELEDFAYVASHDLRTPLMIVQGYLDLVMRTKAHLLDDEGRGYLEAALQGGERMTRFIDDLLMYSRAGEASRELETLELEALVAAVLEEGVRVGEARAFVEVRSLPVVVGDKMMLRQLFQNLLSNALKFVAPDTTPKIVIGSEPDPAPAVIWVSDNGIGIPELDRGRVFQMFTRLEGSRDRPGSGIGLAVCQRVVRAHGGDIWIEDAGGGGTRICFTLPGG